MDQELICRTCLSRTSRCISVFTTPNLWGRPISILKLIMACAPVEISKNDGLPSKICESCLKHLQFSFLFRLRVIEANEKLKSYIRKNLVPRQQPISEGFLEPLAIPVTYEKDFNFSEIFSMDDIVQLANKEHDPLFIDTNSSTNSSNGDTELNVKKEIKNEPELMPIEEVMIGPNAANTTPLLVVDKKLTGSIKEADNSCPLQNPTQVVTKSPAPEHNVSSTSTNFDMQQNSSSVSNPSGIRVIENNLVQLAEGDKYAVQNVLQHLLPNMPNDGNNIFVIKAGQQVVPPQNRSEIGGIRGTASARLLKMSQQLNQPQIRPEGNKRIIAASVQPMTNLHAANSPHIHSENSYPGNNLQSSTNFCRQRLENISFVENLQLVTNLQSAEAGRRKSRSASSVEMATNVRAENLGSEENRGISYDAGFDINANINFSIGLGGQNSTSMQQEHRYILFSANNLVRIAEGNKLALQQVIQDIVPYLCRNGLNGKVLLIKCAQELNQRVVIFPLIKYFVSGNSSGSQLKHLDPNFVNPISAALNSPAITTNFAVPNPNPGNLRSSRSSSNSPNVNREANVSDAPVQNPNLNWSFPNLDQNFMFPEGASYVLFSADNYVQVAEGPRLIIQNTLRSILQNSANGMNGMFFMVKMAQSTDHRAVIMPWMNLDSPYPAVSRNVVRTSTSETTVSPPVNLNDGSDKSQDGVNRRSTNATASDGNSILAALLNSTIPSKLGANINEETETRNRIDLSRITIETLLDSKAASEYHQTRQLGATNIANSSPHLKDTRNNAIAERTTSSSNRQTKSAPFNKATRETRSAARALKGATVQDENGVTEMSSLVKETGSTTKPEASKKVKNVLPSKGTKSVIASTKNVGIPPRSATAPLRKDGVASLSLTQILARNPEEVLSDSTEIQSSSDEFLEEANKNKSKNVGMRKKRAANSSVTSLQPQLMVSLERIPGQPDESSSESRSKEKGLNVADNTNQKSCNSIDLISDDEIVDISIDLTSDDDASSLKKRNKDAVEDSSRKRTAEKIEESIDLTSDDEGTTLVGVKENNNELKVSTTEALKLHINKRIRT